MRGMCFIILVAMTTLRVEAGKEDFIALEKKTQMFQRQLKGQDKRLDNHDARLGKLESEPFLCSKYRLHSYGEKLKLFLKILSLVSNCTSNIRIAISKCAHFLC